MAVRTRPLPRRQRWQVHTNLLTPYDFVDLFHELQRLPLKAVLRRFTLLPSAAVRATWDREDYPQKNWSSIRQIVENNNLLATGDPHREYHRYIAEKYLKKLEPVAGLSLGSGKGNTELEWAKVCRFSELMGVDISSRSVETANRHAREAGAKQVRFVCRDINTMPLERDRYDVVFAQASLHHVRSIENVVKKVNAALKPGGLLVLDEYVGPNRFQYTVRQLTETNRLLVSIPEHYRRRWRLRAIKRKVHRPGLLRMLLSDPSEAVASERILPSVTSCFETVELAMRGGTLLCPLFHDIGQNFTDDDPIAAGIVERCIAAERELIEGGDLPSDFVIGVFRRPEGGVGAKPER